MNIENISALMGQLKLLGFENTGYPLLKRISFRPDHFIFSQSMEKAKDKLSFHLFFERHVRQDVYILMYYDAILQKDTTVAEGSNNGINLISLEKSMMQIDWKYAFDFVSIAPMDLEDKGSWEKEQKVELVIEALSDLEKSEEGKIIAVGLKLKYWAGIAYQELFGNISPLKNKSEVSQRFYFFENQTGISVDEAYRFLLNRWLEKQMQAKKKDEVGDKGDELPDEKQTSSGSGLLQKKRLNISKNVNRKLSSLKK